MQDLQIANFTVHTKSLGAKFLGYILDINDEEMARLLAEGGQITRQQQKALDLANDIFLEQKKLRLHWETIQSLDFLDFCTQKFENGLLPLPGLRSISGGELNALEHDDPVNQALAEIALDCYPYILLGEANGRFDFSLFSLPSFHGSQKLKKFISAVRNDETLMALWPDVTDNDWESGCEYHTSLGNGGSGMQLTLFHTNLILSGVALMHARNESSMISLQKTVWEMLDTLRASLSNKMPKIPIFDVFDLVGLPENFEVSINNSKLTGVPKSFLRHIPTEVRPGQNADGDALGGILIRQCDFNIALRPKGDEIEIENGWPIELTNTTDIKHRMAIALATSLASSDERCSAARWRATITIDPLGGVRQGWTPKNGTLGLNYMLTSDECDNLSGQLKNIEKSDISKIEMAISRFLSAATNRDDLQDSLVDAVIGLESLFGDRAANSLSVASGVANLLGQDIVKRRKLFMNTKSVYNARSTLVHGSQKKASKLDIRREREMALDLLKRSILELLKNRPDLLPLEGPDRVKELIIS